MPVIFTNDFITYDSTDITSRSEASGYDDGNIRNLWNLKRRFRAGDLTKSDTNPLLRIDMSSAQSVAAIFLNDINFDTVRILGHASDLGTNWTTASYDSGDLDVSRDALVNRYKIFKELTSFSYRWLAIATPAAASAVGDYTTTWEVGTVCILDSITEFNEGMSFNYEYRALEEFHDIGRSERIIINANKQAILRVPFGYRAQETNEDDLYLLNNMGQGEPIIFFENQAVTVAASVGSNLLSNGGIEDNAWDDDFFAPVSNAQSTEQVYEGTYSDKVVVDAQYEGIISDHSVSVDVGTTYRVSMAIYGDGTNKVALRFQDTGNTVNYYSTLSVDANGYLYPASWTVETWDITITGGTDPGTLFGSAIAAAGATAGTWYIDAVTVKKVTPESTGTDSSKGYLCKRDTEVSITLAYPETIQGNVIQFTELV